MDITEEIFLESISCHEGILNRFKKKGFPVIHTIIGHLVACFENEGKVLLAGNGGSAADCHHIAGELVGRFKKNRRPIPAQSLVSDTSVLTCIANDYDFNSVFSRQIEALAESRDLLWVLSTSGTSPNIMKAVQTAKENEMKVIAFTGRVDSPLEQISDICLCAGTEKTAHAQEIHQVAYHIICTYLDKIYAE